MNDASPTLAIVMFLLIIVFYFIPCVIAATRCTGHQGAIFFINLLFGWTVLGWIAALIWAIVEKPEVFVDKYAAAPALGDS